MYHCAVRLPARNFSDPGYAIIVRLTDGIGPLKAAYGIQNGTDVLDELSLLVQHGMAECVQVPQRAVGTDVSVLVLVVSALRDGRGEGPLDVWPVLGVDALEDFVVRRLWRVGIVAVDAGCFVRALLLQREGIQRPTADVVLPLRFGEQVLAAPQRLLRPLAFDNFLSQLFVDGGQLSGPFNDPLLKLLLSSFAFGYVEGNSHDADQHFLAIVKRGVGHQDGKVRSIPMLNEPFPCPPFTTLPA